MQPLFDRHAIRGSAPSGLLNSYETERRSAAQRMVLNAQAQAALIAPGSDVTGLREVFTELLRDPSTVQRLAELTAGADVRYDMGGREAPVGSHHDRSVTAIGSDENSGSGCLRTGGSGAPVVKLGHVHNHPDADAPFGDTLAVMFSGAVQGIVHVEAEIHNLTVPGRAKRS
ncbi:hypothetical protein ACTMTI_02675 [Nonomuraea sp. H19]|uniref:hypothetical protein n=1 Tax=Nonomuraea sp. H19 TaxID=3452206 RepID=UPI003F89A54D